MRPARPYSALAITPLILLAWWLVAHNSGSGWVQALGDAVFGVLMIGLFGPAIALGRVRLNVTSVPTDAVAGAEVEVIIDASSRVRLRSLQPPSAVTFLGPAGRQGRVDARLVIMPEHRGEYDHLIVDVSTASPFGLQWWRRKTELALPAALLVAPRRGEPELWKLPVHDDAGRETTRARAEAGQPRGARPFRPGDSRRLVHWQATAHSGELMVRELEGPSTMPVTVEVRLPADPPAAERVAERALATIERLLEQGVSVRLGTLERSGPVLSMVNDRRGLGRRLARAVASRETATDSPGVAISQ